MSVPITTLANQNWQLSLRNQLRQKVTTQPSDFPREQVISRLETLARGSDRILLRIQAIFPFDLFPDVITIDENKINVIHKHFFWSEEVHSVLIDDVTDVFVDRSLFFSTLHVVDSSNVRFPILLSVSKLLPSNALYARRIIQGLIAAKRLKIDISSQSLGSVYILLNKLGGVSGEEPRG